MRWASRADNNQSETIAALRQIGASVVSLHRLGQGVPDLLVGRRGKNLLLEVKDGGKSPSERALTRDEREFHAGWAGQKALVESAAEAVKYVVENT